MRTEKDFLGEVNIPDDKLFGIHAFRASQNFPNRTQFPQEWFCAIGIVKKACYITYRKFRDTALKKNLHPPKGHQWFTDETINALNNAAQAVSEGNYFGHFIVPAIQGGAGTSINMNINEIIANAALIETGHRPGQYDIIDPLDHANIFQSTNDVVPTALHLALIKLTYKLETAINDLRKAVEKLENFYRNELRQGYTQMQKAVPSTYGHFFGSYSNALSRDWWRTSRIRERLKEVNLGGGAIGTGLGIPRFFVLQVVPELRNLTNLPLAHSENLSDATMNHDDLVESHAILKALAVNLEKMSNDLRLLSADTSAHRSVQIPQKQMGSSIMPGKVNPVIPEYVISICQKIYANDHMITNLAAQGCLDLNAYIPSIGTAMLESFKLLESACLSFSANMLSELTLNTEKERASLFKSSSITTALVPYIGHKAAEALALKMKTDNLSVFEANKTLNIMSIKELEKILSLSSITSKGFSLNDLPDNKKKRNKN